MFISIEIKLADNSTNQVFHRWKKTKPAGTKKPPQRVAFCLDIGGPDGIIRNFVTHPMGRPCGRCIRLIAHHKGRHIKLAFKLKSSLSPQATPAPARPASRLLRPYSKLFPDTKKPPQRVAFCLDIGGPDGTRTRDLRRDRPAF